jgi:hypothetical protein
MSTYKVKYLSELWVVGPVRREELSRCVFFWRDYALWLKDQGYLLRQRYQLGSGTSPLDAEDGIRYMVSVRREILYRP